MDKLSHNKYINIVIILIIVNISDEFIKVSVIVSTLNLQFFFTLKEVFGI